MKKHWSKLTIGVILSLVYLFAIPYTAMGAGPEIQCPQNDWSVVDITVTNQWITNQAGTLNATPWATDTNTVTIAVQNNGEQNMPWLPFVTFKNPDGKVESDGIHTNLDLTITDVNGTKTVIKGGNTNFEYTLKAGSEEGMVDICARYDGKEHIIGTIRIFGHTITLFDYWTGWDDFGKYFCDVFGVDSTSPTITATVVSHSNSDTAWGVSRTWQTVDFSAIDSLSGVKCLSEVITQIAHNQQLHTITAIDEAGNIKTIEVVTAESWAGPSTIICEKCWHSLYCGDAQNDWKIQSVFAAGGWYFYKCPFCGYSSESFMRNAYKNFVANGGYVPTGDFYHGMNYKP